MEVNVKVRGNKPNSIHESPKIIIGINLTAQSKNQCNVKPQDISYHAKRVFIHCQAVAAVL
jgi:hypothetical protein